MPKHELNIDVLGCSLSISADENPEYLQSLLGSYKRKLEEIRINTGLKDTLKIAILTGFMLCDELERSKAGKPVNNVQDPGKSGHDEDFKEAEKLTMNLINRLDDLLGNDESKPHPEQFHNQETGEPRAEKIPEGKPVYKLHNVIKIHDWGSPHLMQDFLGKENHEKELWAELWMGVHHEGPSRIIPPEGVTETFSKDGGLPLLGDFILKDPEYCLGEEAKTFGTLPFLFKVLAAGKPLSIQAHPDLTQAGEGFERENREGKPLDSFNRSYKDRNHKPEILCALTPISAMAGFRHPAKIKELLGEFLEDASRDLKAAVFPLINTLGDRENPLKKFMAALFAMPKETRNSLTAYAANKTDDGPAGGEWKLIRKLAELHPGDPAIISPLYLNLIKINPGEAVFTPARVPHAYVEGIGIELMASSDNVLRGGLTTKHVDLPELFKILDFKPFMPEILAEKNSENGLYKYPAPCREFSLGIMKGCELPWPERGPAVVIVTKGDLEIRGNRNSLKLIKGESAFIPANDGCFTMKGDFTLYAACIGS